MTRHSFDPDVAMIVGTDAATIYQNLLWWVEKNAANGRHCHDGKWWTYNSVKAFETLFPYLTGRQIRRCLEKLEEAGFIGSGNFNASAYDRTKWYCVLRQSDLTKMANGFAQKVKPIPVGKPDDKPDDLLSAEPTIDDSDGEFAHDEPEPGQHQAVSADEIAEAVRLYGIVADRKDLPRLRKLTKERRASLGARLREHGLDGWKEALRKLDKSPHCCGQNDRGWRAGIDFLLQPLSFIKLLEGVYDARQAEKPPRPNPVFTL